jgi:hypothetical protein
VVTYVPFRHSSNPFLWRKKISGCSRRIPTSLGNIEKKLSTWSRSKRKGSLRLLAKSTGCPEASNMTLRRKIVALTLCLLLLFTMTAAASVLLQSKISEQFSGVVDDYLPLNAAVATIDVFTDRYELDLRRLAADLRDAGAGAAAITQQGEVERLTEARGLTATFQKPKRSSISLWKTPGRLSKNVWQLPISAAALAT